MARPKARRWTATGAARAAREARAKTVEFARDTPIAVQMQASKLIGALEVLGGQLGDPQAHAVLLGGMGIAPPYPRDLESLARLVLQVEIEHLAGAPLYVLSPAMCDVVAAAAQTLTAEDLALLDADDPPTPAGVLALPHPLLVRAVNGQLGDDRVYTWRTPAEILLPRAHHVTKRIPAVRLSAYHDTHGPVRPDSFTAMAADAAQRGTPLPPWLLDAVKSERLRFTPTARQLDHHEAFTRHAHTLGAAYRVASAAAGVNENDQVVGEYQPGQEINDADDRFTTRFLYAFWRLSAQHISRTDAAPLTHSARVLAERARVDPDVRIVEISTPDPRGRPEADDMTPPASRPDWQHRWVVRMHKVRQWYPTEQRHRVLYRGPYLKGPADKPLLNSDLIRKMSR